MYYKFIEWTHNLLVKPDQTKTAFRIYVHVRVYHLRYNIALLVLARDVQFATEAT